MNTGAPLRSARCSASPCGGGAVCFRRGRAERTPEDRRLLSCGDPRNTRGTSDGTVRSPARSGEAHASAGAVCSVFKDRRPPRAGCAAGVLRPKDRSLRADRPARPLVFSERSEEVRRRKINIRTPGRNYSFFSENKISPPPFLPFPGRKKTPGGSRAGRSSHVAGQISIVRTPPAGRRRA